MNIVASLLSALSFGETGRGPTVLIRRLYFAVAYNTMLPVNAIFALGSVTPLITILAFTHALTAGRLATIVAATILSAYSYNLIYIVNDIIDRRKDETQKIPKQTARHVLGRRYLWPLALSYALIDGSALLAWPKLAVPLAVYSAGLIFLSVAHSKAAKAKAVTIFIERLLKFCSPLAFICLATSSSTALVTLGAALVIYPFSFMFDYSYRGYFRDRLKLPQARRFAVYAAYGVLLLAALSVTGLGATTVAAWPVVVAYGLVYAAMLAVTAVAAGRLPYPFLDRHYTPTVAAEKRKLLTFGLLQSIIVVLGALYVCFN